MDPAYLHLATNHIPVIGVPLGIAVLLFGFWRRSDDLKAMSFLIFAFLGMASIAVFLLGKGGEDFVGEIAGVSGSAIEAHEDFAKYALASVLACALVSAAGLAQFGFSRLIRRPIGDEKRLAEGEVSGNAVSRSKQWASLLALLLGLISAGMLGYTAKLGGKIRHSEFYGGPAAENGEGAGKAEEGEEAEKDGGRGRGRNRGGR